MVTGSGDSVWGSRWLSDGRSGGSRGYAAEVSRRWAFAGGYIVSR
ncbi:hypothetical protein CASFOL_004238 [Castilleja foliolosa]|uniref:Uncharacterized protein n=1 Tax=Castilleja foliolosa TaxID=1961234 RepID=A0ABD3D5B0_9LAMI